MGRDRTGMARNIERARPDDAASPSSSPPISRANRAARARPPPLADSRHGPGDARWGGADVVPRCARAHGASGGEEEEKGVSRARGAGRAERALS
jgi:hypothetical protein